MQFECATLCEIQRITMKLPKTVKTLEKRPLIEQKLSELVDDFGTLETKITYPDQNV